MQNNIKLGVLAGALLALPAIGAPAGLDDFQREGRDRTAKDAMEGKAPPPLQVEGWLNTGGQPLDWASLRGKVVVLDFWGTW